LFGNHYGGDDDDDDDGNDNDDVVVIIIIITTTIMTIIITKQARHDAKIQQIINGHANCVKAARTCKESPRWELVVAVVQCSRRCVQNLQPPKPHTSVASLHAIWLSGDQQCYSCCYDSEEGPNCDESSRIIQHDTLIFRNHHKSTNQLAQIRSLGTDSLVSDVALPRQVLSKGIEIPCIIQQ